MVDKPSIRKANIVESTVSSQRQDFRRWAVIVGISKYQDSTLNLQYADRDAEKLYQALLSRNIGHFLPDYICKLTNKQATKSNITRALRSFLKKPAREDLVIIYFACHGSPDPDRPGNVYLLTYDTDPIDIAGTALPMGDIDRALKDTLLSEKVIILADTCHSAAIGSGMRSRGVGEKTTLINRYLQEISLARGGTALLTSAEANEVSFEDKKWGGGHGVFTYYLLQGLEGKADVNDNGFVTVGELFEYVREQVKVATHHRQHPSIGTNPFDRNLPLAITDPTTEAVNTVRLAGNALIPVSSGNLRPNHLKIRYVAIAITAVIMGGITYFVAKGMVPGNKSDIATEPIEPPVVSKKNESAKEDLENALASADAALALMEPSNHTTQRLEGAISNWNSAMTTLRAISKSSSSHLEATQRSTLYESQLRYAQGLQKGLTAAERSKAGTRNTAQNWNGIVDLWQQAIDHLDAALSKLTQITVTEDKFYNYEQIQHKIEDYKTKKSRANEQRLQAPFKQAVRKANAATDKVAAVQALGQEQSSEDWIEIAALWGEAAELMGQILSPEDDREQSEDRYNEAQKKMREYAQKQDDAQNWSDRLAIGGE